MAFLDIGKSSADEAAKLRKIVEALMWQVERSMDVHGNAYSLFQTATLLEDKVKARTTELEAALKTLEFTNRQLIDAKTTSETAQNRLLEAVESIAEGFALFDSEDRLVLCNSRFKDFWGSGAAAIDAGMTFAELTRRVVEQGLIREATENPQLWLAERLSRHREPHTPFTFRLADGRWLRVDETPTKDGGIVAIYSDISDIKQQEEQRRQRELAEKSVLLQSSLDSLSQGVSVFDRNLELVAWNQCFVELLQLPTEMVELGMPYTEYLRFNIERGTYGDKHAISVESRLAQIRRGDALAIEYQRPDGRVLEIRRNPMPAGGFVTTYSDVTQARSASMELRKAKVHLERRVRERTSELTIVNNQLRQEIAERKEIERALQLAKTEAEQANISKTKFLAAASHDLLQPLNAARLFVSALSDRQLTSNHRELVERVDHALRGVEDMLNALLDISKLDAGAVPTEIREFPVSALLDRLSAEFSPIAADAGLDFRVIPCGVPVRTDRRLLGRIVRNLISNAIRYTPAGRIIVGCRRCGEQLRLQVMDTGIGIPEDMLVEIFEEFRQLGGRSRSSDKGVGLGLSIVKRIARILDHPISVRSISDVGSVFSIDLPRAPLSNSTQPKPAMVERGDDPVEGLRIVVLDNEEAILDGMRTLLEGWGCHVMTATGVTAALRKTLAAEGCNADLAIIDYHLDAGRNGIDGLMMLRKEICEDLPGIVVTADRTEQVKRIVRDNGLYLLNKPLRPARLRALIGHIHANRA